MGTSGSGSGRRDRDCGGVGLSRRSVSAFLGSGVAVNRNSAMYYVNQTPVGVPPSNLRPSTPPRWSSVSGGHSYSWHDGRLHALRRRLDSGASYVGRWTIPVRVDGR